jgi:hypothetical protein
MAVVGECERDLGQFFTEVKKWLNQKVNTKYFAFTSTTNQVAYGGLQYWAAFS